MLSVQLAATSGKGKKRLNLLLSAGRILQLKKSYSPYSTPQIESQFGTSASGYQAFAIGIGRWNTFHIQFKESGNRNVASCF